MNLVEIFLPIFKNLENSSQSAKIESLRVDLTKRFGGITAFTRAPAQGSTRDHEQTIHDDIIIFEVMTNELDREWWTLLKKKLEEEFGQNEILIRVSSIEKL